MSAAEGVPGTRVGPYEPDNAPILGAGEYGQIGSTWYCCTPTGLMGNLVAHSVIEHEDGTITVTPSILIHPARGSTGWHGYLDRGIWREC